MKIVTTEEYIEHPMEEIFDIESGSTLITKEELQSDGLVTLHSYDDKDLEVESQFQEVYDAAMTSFADQAGLLHTSDPKYSARNMEVANAFLNTALAAAKEKANIKQHKDKIAKGEGPRTVNNNLIMDRNVLLKMLKDGGQ